MAGEDQGHDLVAELAIGHPGPVLVACGQQAREQVATVSAFGRGGPR